MDSEILSNSAKNWLSASCQPQYWSNPSLNCLSVSSHPDSNSVNTWRTCGDLEDVCARATQCQQISEYEALKELIWSFQQFRPSSVIFTICNGKSLPKPAITVPSLVSESFQNFLVAFGEALDALNALRYFCTRTMTNPSNSTFEAYASALSTRINAFQNSLARIETRVQKQEETVTLLTLQNLLKEELTCFQSLCRTHIKAVDSVEISSSCSSAVKLSTVWMEETDQAQLKDIYFIDYLQIFLAIIRPYLFIIDAWFTTGRLIDRFEEFFFSVPCPKQSQSWDAIVIFKDPHIQHQMETNSLWFSTLDKLRLAGKSREVLSRMGEKASSWGSQITLYDQFLDSLMSDSSSAENEGIVGSSPWEFKNLTDVACSLLSEKLTFKNFSTSKTPPLKYKSSLLVSVAVERALAIQISRYYNCICPALIQVVRDKCGLRQHLTALRSVYFMESGDILSDVCSEIFAKINNDEKWEDESYLTSLLRSATQPRISTAKNFSVCLSAPSGVHFSNVMVHYEVPWPLSIVITPSSLQIYNEIFRFSLILMRSLKALQGLLFKDLEQASEHCLDNPGESLPTVLRMRRLHLLRSWLLHFLGSIRAYVVNSLHINALQAEEAIMKATNLGQAALEHKRFMNTVYEQCLFHVPLQLLRKMIFEVCDIALTVVQIWNQGIQSLPTTLLCQLEAKYVDCHRFVAALLTATLERQQIPYIESLTATLTHSCPDTNPNN